MIFAALFCVALVGAAPGPLLTYTAPAGVQPAGARDQPFDGILPSGRLLGPVGLSVVVGMNALGVALTPDGRYAIVTNDDEREFGIHSRLDPRIGGGYSLAVVDTNSMHVSDWYSAKDREAFFLGVAALKDPANPARTLVLASGGPTNSVRVFILDGDGHLSAQDKQVEIPGNPDEDLAGPHQSFPGSIILSPDKRRAYVVNNLGNSVSAIDTQTRTLLNTANVGFFPYGVALAGKRLLVTDEGLMQYGKLSVPTAIPQFLSPLPNPSRASAVSLVGLDSSGNVVSNNQAEFSVSMDAAPDGIATVGGAHPSAILATPDKRYAFVTMTNVDRVATLALNGASPSLAASLELRLFDGAPYGMQPNALAMSKNGARLYVAMSGVNAVAVVDARNPLHLNRLGLIPTGWYPSALALSPNGRYLYVANAKGLGEDRVGLGDSNAIWSTLQRIDLKHLVLKNTTLNALANARTSRNGPDNAVVPPLGVLRPSSVIKHVVFILEENKTYDAMLGDLKDETGRAYGAGDASLVSFGASVTPNLHALARTFGLATNLYADAEESDAGHQFAAGGIATDYTEKTLLLKDGRRPFVNKNEDPEDYPRAGYIFHNLARTGGTFREYGDLVRLSGYDEGANIDPKADDRQFAGEADESAPTQGLGGLYPFDVPAPAVLNGHIDLRYPGWNLRIRDVRRAKEFIRDYSAYVRDGTVPAFTYVWLPADHGGHGRNIPSLPEEVADGDRALGLIVDYLSHLPTWATTAIFITPDDAQSSRDHVHAHRTYAVVVSPFSKRAYLGSAHTSTVSILKTEEELLGLPALSLGDLLATDLADFFTAQPDLRPYEAIAVPRQTSSREGERITALLERTNQGGPDADASRSSKIVALSREADALAGQRNHGLSYERAQAQLYARALHVLNEVKSAQP
ncbi:MAG: hypothetical protein M3Z14_02865 [Candidatus Eremiobacteraeota bacterium]|nr:hypothetical protein [Candidatus Eremiobacteraeota bacterium]